MDIQKLKFDQAKVILWHDGLDILATQKDKITDTKYLSYLIDVDIGENNVCDTTYIVLPLNEKNEYIVDLGWEEIVNHITENIDKCFVMICNKTQDEPIFKTKEEFDVSQYI